jgi:hypothetical protein
VKPTSTASSVRLRARMTPANAVSTSSTCQNRSIPDGREPACDGRSHNRGSFEATIPANRTGRSRG